MAYYFKRALLVLALGLIAAVAVFLVGRLEGERHEATSRIALSDEVQFYDVEQEREARARVIETEAFRADLDAVADTAALQSLSSSTAVRTDFVDITVVADTPEAAIAIATAAAELAAEQSAVEATGALQPEVDSLEARQEELQAEIDAIDAQLTPLWGREGELALVEAELLRAADAEPELADARLERNVVQDDIAVLARERNSLLDLQDVAGRRLFQLELDLLASSGAVEVEVLPESSSSLGASQSRAIVAAGLAMLAAVAALFIQARHFGPIRSARALRTNFAPIRVRDWQAGEKLDDVFVREPASGLPVSATCPAVIGIDGADAASVAKQMAVGWTNAGLDAVLADARDETDDLQSMKRRHDVVVLDFGDLSTLDRAMRAKLSLATEVDLVVRTTTTDHRTVRGLIDAFEQRGLPVREIVLGPTSA